MFMMISDDNHDDGVGKIVMKMELWTLGLVILKRPKIKFVLFVIL